MPAPTFRRSALASCLLLVLTVVAVDPVSAGGSNIFCGGAATPGDPSDLANVVGDLTLEYSAQQPANIVTCSQGYLLEKCGDHETAHKVFDKCIAAGYVGAMIWKALLLEDGKGVQQDSVKAAELLHRAAVSDDPGYAAIGKMHYATALYQGRGVEKNEAEALLWFQAAAAEGSQEARDFLATGYHTGVRDLSGMGAGTPTAAALAGASTSAPTGDNASLPQPPQKATPTGLPLGAVRLAHQPMPPALAPVPRPTPAATPAPLEAEVQGQKLESHAPLPPADLPAASTGLGLILLASFLAGIIRQRRLVRQGRIGIPTRSSTLHPS